MITRQSVLAIVVIALLLGGGILFVQQSGTPEPESQETVWQPAPAVTGQPASSNEQATSSGKAGALSQMVIKLEQRLQQQGGSADDWLLLGKTYQYLGRSADADMAYNKARELGYDPDKLNNARSAMKQQMAASAPRIAPPSHKMNSLELAAIDQSLSKNSGSEEAGAAKGTVRGTLTLAPELQAQLPASATLFIFARDAKQARSAPFAVIRTQNVQFPISFQLNDSHAVVPGRTLSSAGTVVIGARLTTSGNASGQRGDLEGLSSPINVSDSASVALEINKIRQQ